MTIPRHTPFQKPPLTCGATAALVLWAGAAFSDVCTEQQIGSDPVSLCIDGLAGTFTYENSAQKRSVEGMHSIQAGGIRLFFHVEVVVERMEKLHETVTLFPPATLIAMPTQADIQDGEHHVFILMKPGS